MKRKEKIDRDTMRLFTLLWILLSLLWFVSEWSLSKMKVDQMLGYHDCITITKGDTIHVKHLLLELKQIARNAIF